MKNEEIKKELEEIRARLDKVAKLTSAVSSTPRTSVQLADHRRIVDAYFSVSIAFWKFGKEE